MITKCLVQLLEYTLPPSAKSPRLPEFCLFCQSFVNAIVPPWSGERGGGIGNNASNLELIIAFKCVQS